MFKKLHVCFTEEEENTDKFDENLLTDDKYKDELH